MSPKKNAGIPGNEMTDLRDQVEELKKENSGLSRTIGELRESEALFRTLAETVHASVIIRDRENLFYANSKFIKISGFDPDELDAKEMMFLIAPEYRNKLVNVMQDVLGKKMDSYRTELKLMPPDGREIWVELSGSPIDYKGKPALLGTGIDVTERKVAQDKLEKLNAELEKKIEERTHELKENQLRLAQAEKMASLAHITGAVAHEINSPLAVLQSNINTGLRALRKLKISLKDHAEGSGANDSAVLTDEIIRMHSTNKEAAERIGVIVDSLKKFIRLDKAGKDYCDIHEGIKNTLTIIRHKLIDRIRIIEDFGEIGKIICFPDEINQLFMHLIVNSAHAIEGKGEIHIITKREKNTIFITISDTGKGIPNKLLKTIFEPGFTTKREESSGLGLSIVNHIVQHHKGEIKISSTVGKGTQITICLPTELN